HRLGPGPHGARSGRARRRGRLRHPGHRAQVPRGRRARPPPRPRRARGRGPHQGGLSPVVAPALPGPDGPGPAVHGFLEELRRQGVAVPVGSALLYVEALARLEPAPDALYWAGRATLVHRLEEIGPYDLAFSRWWL